MRKMRKFLNILFLCTLALGLSSCEPDDGEDYYIYDTLLGGIWVGDLGFADAYNSPSTIARACARSLKMNGRSNAPFAGT